VGQCGPPRGAEVGDEILLQDLFAGRVVVGAGPAPRVVVGDEHDAVVALPRDGEEVVPARGAHGPRGQALSLDHDPLSEFHAEPGDELFDLPLVPLIASFQGQLAAVPADVLQDFRDPGVHRRAFHDSSKRIG